MSYWLTLRKAFTNARATMPRSPPMAKSQTLEVPVKGMDCAECTQHVQHAIAKLPGVESVNVLLASEKAIIQLDPTKVDLPAIREAVASAGNYVVPETASASSAPPIDAFNR